MKSKVFLPLFFAIAIIIGIFIGELLPHNGTFKNPFTSLRNQQVNKLNEVVNYIHDDYVDTINETKIVEGAITGLLHDLDPHSIYIPAEDFKDVNEPLEGNFEGVGIEFHIQDDTIMVISAIAGGPSESVGIRSGDRLVSVNGKNIAGTKITNKDVVKLLRGETGSKVTVGIVRLGTAGIKDYKISRGKIPIYSVDVGYMINPTIGYIKISRFANNTYEEFMEKLDALLKAGMKSLILDLKGNPGGYLSAATKITDEFLDGNKMIVYTQGQARKKTEYSASSNGAFLHGKLLVLIDEGSASASEIVSGALQDWDRATIVGRRSFGKGLVQEQTDFPDGSAMRLTVARYYTPTGRCIQRPYDHGTESYYDNVRDRATNGELESLDSIHLPDSLKFKTPGGKTVYGGGGIM
ncbi:MAG: S41 family peptidase, partial [Bacteroidota bacterium]